MASCDVDAKVYPPAPFSSIPSLVWEKIYLTVVETGALFDDIPTKKRATYARGLIAESGSHEQADRLQAAYFICELGDEFVAKLKSLETMAYIGRMQRGASILNDDYVHMLNTFAYDVFNESVPDFFKDAIKDCLQHLTDKTWGKTYPDHIHHYHDVMSDDTSTLEDRQKAQVCVDVIMVLMTSPLKKQAVKDIIDRSLLLPLLVSVPEKKEHLDIDVLFYNATFAEAFRRVVCFANRLPVQKSMPVKGPSDADRILRGLLGMFRGSTADPDESPKQVAINVPAKDEDSADAIIEAITKEISEDVNEEK